MYFVNIDKIFINLAVKKILEEPDAFSEFNQTSTFFLREQPSKLERAAANVTTPAPSTTVERKSSK